MDWLPRLLEALPRAVAQLGMWNAVALLLLVILLVVAWKHPPKTFRWWADRVLIFVVITLWMGRVVQVAVDVSGVAGGRSTAAGSITVTPPESAR